MEMYWNSWNTQENRATLRTFQGIVLGETIPNLKEKTGKIIGKITSKDISNGFEPACCQMLCAYMLPLHQSPHYPKVSVERNQGSGLYSKWVRASIGIKRKQKSCVVQNVSRVSSNQIQSIQCGKVAFGLAYRIEEDEFKTIKTYSKGITLSKKRSA